MLHAANQKLYPGCENHSQLSLAAHLLNIKVEHDLSEKAFDVVAGLIKEVVLCDNVAANSFYSTKKLLRGLGLLVNKIDCYSNNCIIY